MDGWVYTNGKAMQVFSGKKDKMDRCRGETRINRDSERKGKRKEKNRNDEIVVC